MPVLLPEDEILFPDFKYADADGLLAVGGDLSPERLIEAYANGVFPWYNEGNPLLWWAPDPRMVLFPEKFIVRKSLRQTLRKGIFRVTFDTAFERVIAACAQAPRAKQEGTWITREMMQAYIHLHELGFAHSVECWQQEQLVGGLYGVSLGAAFFGESMFHRVSDASKVAFYHLVEKLKEWDFELIDAQMETDHLKRLGAENISRGSFSQKLDHCLEQPTRRGKWKYDSVNLPGQ